jgi:hypothetical protein
MVTALGPRVTASVRKKAETYRPELHYMWDPGPKWREKFATE